MGAWLPTGQSHNCPTGPLICKVCQGIPCVWQNTALSNGMNTEPMPPPGETPGSLSRKESELESSRATIIQVLGWLDQWSPATASLVGVVLIFSIGLLGYLTGPQLSSSFLYLIPILLVTRVAGFRAGILAATLAAMIWLVGDLNARHQFANSVTPYWNFLMRVATFLVAVGLVAAMGTLHAHLENRVRERTAALEAQIAENRKLETTILNLSDTERAAIGQDLHDGLCQQLVSAAFSTNILEKELIRKDLPEAERASRIADMIDEGITQARNLARGLYPVRLETEGLEMALRELAVVIGRRYGLECRMHCEHPLPPFKANLGIHLYRITQEALVNAAKHSQARNLIIHLTMKDNRVRLEVVDDGTGIDRQQENPAGMGLKIMEYRARMIGADFTIRNRQGGGTLVACETIAEPLEKTQT